MSGKVCKQQKNVLSREQEYQKLFNMALEAYKNKDFKKSYSIHLINGYGVTKNQNYAHSLFEEVSTSNSNYKKAAEEACNK
ncbi:12221_t:CDS:2 [Cetraspora pellucida]|uniref:12221_t:CDS:1 n=1 Tax=Cetraspora pellucida TaxID=1433469 RepID=A0ACA9MZL2_9GLOM|nr:12221_t:CDS:2 [Cetraspora pellucida]